MEITNSSIGIIRPPFCRQNEGKVGELLYYSIKQFYNLLINTKDACSQPQCLQASFISLLIIEKIQFLCYTIYIISIKAKRNPRSAIPWASDIYKPNVRAESG